MKFKIDEGQAHALNYIPMFKNYLMKKMMQSQLGKLPPEHRDMIEKLLEKDPDTLMQMATELQAELAKGKSQHEAFQTIGKKYQDKIRKLME